MNINMIGIVERDARAQELEMTETARAGSSGSPQPKSRRAEQGSKDRTRNERLAMNDAKFLMFVDEILLGDLGTESTRDTFILRHSRVTFILRHSE